MLRNTFTLLCLASLPGLTACAHSPAYDPQDPLEKINRPIFTFNLKADKYVLRPVAKTYVKVVPDFARKGISNFFDNLYYPTTIVSDLLQAKFKQGGQDTLRFVLNSTIGLVGFIDVASTQGLMAHDEDLGQTFGYWGIGPGWYLMVPLLGPYTNRDLVGRVGDNWTEVVTYVDSINFYDRVIIAGAGFVDTRAKLLGADKVLDQQLDPYVFFRTAYLENRQNKVYDGHPPEDDIDYSDADEAADTAADAKTAEAKKDKKKKKDEK